MNPFALVPLRFWLYLGAAVAAFFAYQWWAGQQRDIGRQEVRAEWAAEKTQQQAAALAQARDNAKETLRRIDRQQEAQHAFDKDAAQARADAVAAAGTAGRLRDQLAAFTAGRTPSDTATSSDSEAARATASVLADMLVGMEQDGRGLAAALDASRAAGLQCSRAYEALRQ
ncbi:MAG: DUF2514 family protein [Rhodocyclaceae bacterium]